MSQNYIYLAKKKDLLLVINCWLRLSNVVKYQKKFLTKINKLRNFYESYIVHISQIRSYNIRKFCIKFGFMRFYAGVLP